MDLHAAHPYRHINCNTIHSTITKYPHSSISFISSQKTDTIHTATTTSFNFNNASFARTSRSSDCCTRGTVFLPKQEW